LKALSFPSRTRNAVTNRLSDPINLAFEVIFMVDNGWFV
jgi:hypothetical protein